MKKLSYLKTKYKIGTFIINTLFKESGRYLSSTHFTCSQKQSSLKQLSLVIEDVLKNTLQWIGVVLNFPVFGLNKEIYYVNLRIHSENRKIRTKKTPYLDAFHAVQLGLTMMVLVGFKNCPFVFSDDGHVSSVLHIEYS